MNSSSIMCKTSACGAPVEVSETGSISKFFNQMAHLYRTTTIAGDNAAQYWADIAVKSKHPLAPLAHVPGVFAALWTPEVAPTTAITLATAGYGFATLPKNLVHFTTAKRAQGISASATINSTKFGLFGPGVYMASTGRPINLFVRAAAKTPIYLATLRGLLALFHILFMLGGG